MRRVASISFLDLLADPRPFDLNAEIAATVSFGPPAFSGTADCGGILDPITLGGVTIRSVSPSGPNLYVAVPGGVAQQTGFRQPLATNAVTSSGDEDIDIAFSTGPTAVAFEYYANGFSPLTVSVYDTSGDLLEAALLPSADGPVRGALGVLSAAPIGRINWRSTNGGTIDTGIGPIRYGAVKMIPDGLYLKEWMRLGGPNGPVGWPVAPLAPYPDGPGGVVAFQNGQIGRSPDVWPNGVIAAYQDGGSVLFDWIVSWDDGPGDFNYDRFIVRLERDGHDALQFDVDDGEYQLRTRGSYRFHLEGQPDGACLVKIEGGDLGPGFRSRQGWLRPLRVDFRNGRRDLNKFASLDLTRIEPARTVAASRAAMDDRTAAAVLCNACQVLPHSHFHQEGDFGLIALAKLAFPAFFQGDRLPWRNYDVRQEVYEAVRRQRVNAKVGTDMASVRTGDYDPAVLRYLIMVYKYGDALPADVRDHITGTLLSVRGPYDPDDLRLFTGQPVVISESENHVIMIEVCRYLTNQLLHDGGAGGAFDNRTNGTTDFLLGWLQGVLKHDFVEYNARPYQDYTMAGLLCLYSFARDPAVRTAIRSVLDYVMAKLAVSSNDSRRSVPFRRRNEPEHRNPDFVAGEGCDPQNAFLMGFAGATDLVRAAPTVPQFALEIQFAGLSDYRVPDPVLDLIVNRPHRTFFQRFAHHARETYWGSPSYLISAGGHAAGPAYVVDARAAGPLLGAAGGVIGGVVSGILRGGPGGPVYAIAAWLVGDALVEHAPGLLHDDDFVSQNGNVFRKSDLGLALPTALLPSGQGRSLLELIRFEGEPDDDKRWNLGVDRDFACGLRPVVPPFLAHAVIAADDDGRTSAEDLDARPWTFVNMPTPLERHWLDAGPKTYADDGCGYFAAVFRRQSAVFRQPTPVAAVSRNHDQMDLFAVADDGGVYNAAWNGAWGDWTRVTSKTFAKGTPVAAVSRNHDQMDLFAVADDGGVYNAAWNGAWGDWTRVTSKTFPPGTPIGTAARSDGNYMDLFAVADDGGVYNAAWNGAWGDWTRIGDQTTFPLKTPVAAFRRTDDIIDLFAVREGDVLNAGWNGSWGGWVAVADGRVFDRRPLSGVAAVSRNPDQIDIFTAFNGDVYATGWNGAWGGWHPLGRGFGLLEVYDVAAAAAAGTRALSFQEFYYGVLSRNRVAARAYTATGTNTYVMSDGRAVQFQISPRTEIVRPAEDAFFLKGDVLNSVSGSGVVTIDNAFLKKRIRIDFSDVKTPRREESDLN